MQSRREILRSALLASLVLAGLQTTACWDSRCGKGMGYTGYSCIPLADARRDASAADHSKAEAAVASDRRVEGGAADRTAAHDADSGLGKVCTGQEQCTGAASFCAMKPPAAEGYCTFKDCSLTANDCPTGYFCIDLSAYLPNLTACVKV